jgi:antirestriction protein ArdC
LQQQLQPASKEADMRPDIYQNITDRIVRELENGVRPWHQPWNAGRMDERVVLPLRHNRVAYRGANVLALWMQAMAKCYAAPVWMTFKQALDLGGCELCSWLKPRPSPGSPRPRCASRWRLIRLLRRR